MNAWRLAKSTQQTQYNLNIREDECMCVTAITSAIVLHQAKMANVFSQTRNQQPSSSRG
jgi:hypothetical protein